MGIPWYILALPILVQSVIGLTLEGGDSELILNFTIDEKTSNQYNMLLQEGNHIDGADRILLFTFVGASSKPSCDFLPAATSFKYEIDEYAFISTQFFDYETQPKSYTMQCSVDNDYVIVLISIYNYDDESPTLTSPMCTMKENFKYIEANTTCTCTLSDADGWLNQTTFQVINSNPDATEDLEKEDKLFDFDFDRTIGDNVYNTTVYITTLQTLDYETKIFYSFTVQAKDGAGHSTIPNENVTCIIDVQDQNDQPPQWTDYFTTQQITEEEAYIFHVTAVDGDRGINAPIEYFLVSADEDVCGEDPCVSVTTENGKGIITVKPIDRDAMDLMTYKFEIMAREVDEPPYTTPTNITFFIEDIDDNSPLVMELTPSNSTATNYTDVETKIAEFQFYENFAGTVDGKINIKDIDTGTNAQFNVVLNDSLTGDVTYTDAFLIVPTAGYRTGDFQIGVKNAKYLDFEDPPWQHIQFYVHPYGYTNSSKEDHLFVKITLLDYNDEVPKFKETAYSQSVNETIKKDEFIIQVKATDRDAEDATLTHKLQGADAIIKLLAIDETEGIITVAAKDAFDYDRVNPISFQVNAIDHADPPHITTVPVTVTLLDINNKAPTYIVKDVIRVDENQIIGIPLNATITASDVDTTRNLTAEIVWDKSYVTKNSQRLNSGNPDIEKAMQFLDLAFEKISNDTITITLTVSDNNDNATAPDYETFDTLYLDILIIDHNTLLPDFADKMSIDALIVININDINDNPPIFTNETLAKKRSVYERSKADTIVGTIEAIDADVGDVVTYTCTYQVEKYDWFTCSPEGVLTVNKSDVIDCDTDKIDNVTISCNATDGLFITSQDFTINIRDKNNKWPQIEVNDSVPSALLVELYEKSEQNTIVTNIGYTDDDRDKPFRTAVCTFKDTTTDCSEQFVVKNNTVLVINGGKQLDRDNGTQTYDCTVYCVDNPQYDEDEPQNTNDTQFTIILLDVNDHCPELQTFELTTSENTQEGTLIGDVIAEDIDEGQNAEIVIGILTTTKDGQSYPDLFDMVQRDDYPLSNTTKKWHLKANKDLRDFYGEYTLQLVLNDLGSPPQSTEDEKNKKLKEKSILKVTITKFNYYAPKFIFPDEDSTNMVLSTEQLARTPLVEYLNGIYLPNISISTGEDNECLEKWEPTFDATLTGSSKSLENFFVVEKLGKCIAQLQVDETYKKGQNTYEVELTTKLSDATQSKDEKDYSTSVKLTIGFADPNGYPVFNSTLGPWNITIPEVNKTASETLPDERRAYYPYVNLTITVFYFVYTDNTSVSNMFNMDSDTLTLKKSLDYLENNYYEFQILASRSQTKVTDPDSASLLQVHLWVEDVNNHAPEWIQDKFFGAIMKSTQKGTIILTATATDLDTIDQDKLKYSIVGEVQAIGSDSIKNIVEPFLMDESTGDIKLNFQVEYNMNGHFFFTINVEDAKDRFGNGPHDTPSSVTIYIVTDDNTLTFKFENDLDTVVKNKVNITETLSDALGWECHDYSIDHDSQNGVSLDNVTAFNVYCVSNNTLVTSSDIKSKLNNINTFKQVRQGLLQYGVLLLDFDSETTTPENLETTLKAALIGVSVVLGALCIILAVTFFLKARELNRRLKLLTEPKFGSDESNINRKGINAPTTNVFAVEGSNPVFNNDIKRDDIMEYDKRSINSGDSELIGVEDSPEFDGIFNDVHTSQQRF